MLYHKFEVLRGFFAFLLPKARLRQTQRRCSAFASPRRFRQTNLLQTQRRCSAFASPRLADFVRSSSARRSADMEQWLSQMDKWLRQIEQWVRQQPAEQLYVAAAVVIIASTLLILLRSFNRSKANTIIIAGLSGSGKTTLFYQLRGGSSHLGTVTSMEPNDDMFVLHSELEKKDKMKPVRVVDVPGHSRLRPKLDEYLPQAAGLIFVVDALDFLSNCRMAAEYLYDILTKATIVKKKIPVIILCNKTDKVTAHSKEFIKKQLEKEIDKLRASRTTISAADVTNEYSLGKSGEPFSFSHCLNQISVAEASALTGELTQAEHFIREHVKP